MAESILIQEFQIERSILQRRKSGDTHGKKPEKYGTLRDRLRENSDFQDAANFTFDVAGSIYGKGSKEQKAVSNAWSMWVSKFRTRNITNS